MNDDVENRIAPRREEERRGKLSLKTKIIAGLAGASVVGGSVAGLVISNSSNAEPREQEQGNEQPTSEPTTPETETTEESVRTFPGTAIPESLSEASEELPTTIMKGSLYETLTSEQKSRVDGWYDAIYTNGTFLDLPIEERMAAMSYVFAANYGGASNRINNSDRNDIKTLFNEAGTPSLDNSAEQAIDQVELYQILAGQLAYDSDPSPDTMAGSLDKMLAGYLVAGTHTNPDEQMGRLADFNQTDSMIVYTRSELLTFTVLESTRSDNNIETTIRLGGDSIFHSSLTFVNFTDINGEALGAWVAN